MPQLQLLDTQRPSWAPQVAVGGVDMLGTGASATRKASTKVVLVFGLAEPRGITAAMLLQKLSSKSC